MTQIHTFTRPQVFAALREIVRSLSSAWDLDTTLDLITRKTTEVMNVDSCTIYLLDPEGESLRLQASTGLAKRAFGRSVLRVGEGMTGYAVVHNKPIFAADARNNPYFKWVEEAEETGFKSLLAVPLVLDNKPIGALNVQTAEVHKYTPDEVEILSLIGDLAATTLARAQLYDRQRRQIAELQTLAEISETVTSPIYLDEMLGIVSEMAAQIMDASVCQIYLLDDARSILQRYSSIETNGSPSEIPIDTGIIGRVASSGKPIYVADLTDEPAFEEKELAREAGFVSLLAVPLSVRDRAIGVLGCFTRTYRDFAEKEETLLVTLANQTALAIENAQLITNTAVVREMHHRVKNNLQTIAMLMQLQVYETDHPATRQALETNIHRIRSIAAVHEALSEKGFHLVDVKEVIDQITRTTGESMVSPDQNVSINVHGPSLQLPSRAATALALVINELVQNALEHGLTNQREGQIDISLGRSAVEFIILVRDNGSGLPDNFSSNLGLEICETLVHDDLSGQIKFNRLQQGTEVSIRIPRRLESER